MQKLGVDSLKRRRGDTNVNHLSTTSSYHKQNRDALSYVSGFQRCKTMRSSDKDRGQIVHRSLGSATFSGLYRKEGIC